MPHRVADFFRSSTENISNAALTTIKSSVRNPQAADGQQNRRRPRLERQPSDSPDNTDTGEEIPYHQMYHGGGPFPQIGARANQGREKEQKEKERKEKEKKEKERKEKEKKQKAEKKDKSPRLMSLPVFGRSKDAQNPHATLDLQIESPPIVFFGDVETSSGALISGQMFLDIKDEHFEIERLSAKLQIRVHHKKAFQGHCHECSDQYTPLRDWTFISAPATLPKGRHSYPFSILLDGHLPASMDTPLVRVSYELKAEATTSAATRANQKMSNIPIKLDRLFDVKRSLPVPDSPHQSIRVFPPTNIKASAHYDQIVHPTDPGHRVQLRLDGLTSVNSQSNTIEYWKLKKVTWRLEETIKTIAPACNKHLPAQHQHSPAHENTVSATNGNKGAPRTETRVLGEKHMYDGWKSDFSATDGTVDFEFDYTVAPPAVGSGNGAILGHSRDGSNSSSASAASEHHHGGNPPPQPTRHVNGQAFSSGRYACDTRSRDGTEVSHTLMIEMVVSKEWAPLNKPHLAAQTGTGRILRMQYHVLLTDSPGQGVAWDNESPPVYQEVPPSPPVYQGGAMELPPPFEDNVSEGSDVSFGNVEPIDASTRMASPEPALTFSWDRAARDGDDTLW